MLLRLRMSLPDRPGSLGRVTGTLGALNADVIHVSVLSRESGRAWDDFTVTWPEKRSLEDLVAALTAVPSVEVEGVWRTRDAPGHYPHLDVLHHIVRQPDRAFATLVDALPGILNASWAAALLHVEGESVVHTSAGAPAVEDMPEVRPLRATAFTGEGGVHFGALTEPGGGTVLLARTEGAPFHRIELEEFTQLVEVVRAMVPLGPGRRVPNAAVPLAEASP